MHFLGNYAQGTFKFQVEVELIALFFLLFIITKTRYQNDLFLGSHLRYHLTG